MAEKETETREADIRARIAAHDPAALELLWADYAADLLGYLVALHRSKHEAEDSLQEVFVTLAAKRGRVAAARNLKPYLFRLARNVAYNRIKRENRNREKLLRAGAWLEAETPAEPDGEERSRRLSAALACLPERQRAVVVLKFFRDKTLREIGEMLDISGNTAASCLRYGMEKLRALMHEEGPI